MVDEAHTTQEGNLGQKMRRALPNAFFFGFTGTPINQVDRNTFRTFGVPEDTNRYMSWYSFKDSLRDKTTLELHFEPRMVKYHVNREEIDREFAELTDNLEEDSKRLLANRASRRSIFIHAEERVREITANIVEHYTERVEPNGFKAMIVCYDQDACVQYKEELDKIFPPEGSEIIMTIAPGEEREHIKF